MTRRDPSDMLPVAPALVMVVYCSSRDQATHMRVMGGVHLLHMQPRLDVWIGITFRTEPGDLRIWVNLAKHVRVSRSAVFCTWYPVPSPEDWSSKVRWTPLYVALADPQTSTNYITLATINGVSNDGKC